MSRQTKDRQLLRFVTETPWAILPSALATIQQIVAFHAQGGRLTKEEIRETLGAVKPRDRVAGAGSIAVLPLWGVIAPHVGIMSEISGGTALDTWRDDFRSFVGDPSVDTIVIDIDSPGGSVSLVQETAAEIRAARSTKHVVAVANTMAASAAFYLGSQADELYVTPSGFVGAVHTYMLNEDISEALAMEGIKVDLIGAPNGGDAERLSFMPLSDENRAHLQRTVDQFYAAFVRDVAAGRGVDASTVESSYGQGRVLTARDALAAGMVDGVASLEQVLGKLTKGRSVGRAAALASRDFAGGLGVAAELNTGFTSGAARIAITDTTNEIKSASAETSRTAREASATRREETTMDPVITDDRPLTREELLAEQAEIKARQDELDADAQGREYTAEEQSEDDLLEERLVKSQKLLAHLDERAERKRRRAGEAAAKQPPVKGDGGNGTPEWGGNTNVGRRGPENIFDLAAYRRHAGSVDQLGPLWADGAKRANEITRYRTPMRDETKAFVERLIQVSEEKNNTAESFAHRILITADPAYEQAFGRWIMGRDHGRDSDRIRAAITETGLSSETPVPVTIDPTVLFSGDGSRDPLRTLARVVTITGMTWRGIATDGITMSYAAEASAFSPSTPSFDAPDVSVKKAKGEIQFTVEVDTDWPSLREELQREFAQAKQDLEANKFLLGTGTNEPEGLLHALVTDGTSIVPTATHDVIAIADVTNTSDDLPANFDSNAAWLAHKKFYSKVRALARAAGVADPWTDLVPGFQAANALVKGRLHGSDAYTHSEMSSLFDTASEEVAIIGDFARGFVIVDRVGLNVELDPHPRDGNGAWLGQRALLAWFRNNTALRTPNAFRVLQVKGT